MIQVYSQPNCQPCKATYRALDRAGLEYEVIDLTSDEGALDRIKAMGYSASPVVVVDADTHWSGFRPDLIKKAATHAA